jgi:hypothetical protein
MWGITIYLIRLADYIQRRKDRMTCSICNKVLKNEIELDKHLRKEHAVNSTER